jgi:hypothetical protein
MFPAQPDHVSKCVSDFGVWRLSRHPGFFFLFGDLATVVRDFIGIRVDQMNPMSSEINVLSRQPIEPVSVTRGNGHDSSVRWILFLPCLYLV